MSLLKELHNSISEADDEELDEPRVIAKAGEFQVLLLPDEQVILQNIKQSKDIVKMPMIIWKQLSRSL